MELEIPRDREGIFEPVPVPKGRRRFPGFDGKVIALDDAKAWQSRPLDAVYAMVFLDAIHVKIRTGGHVQT